MQKRATMPKFNEAGGRLACISTERFIDRDLLLKQFDEIHFAVVSKFARTMLIEYVPAMPSGESLGSNYSDGSGDNGGNANDACNGDDDASWNCDNYN